MSGEPGLVQELLGDDRAGLLPDVRVRRPPIAVIAKRQPHVHPRRYFFKKLTGGNMILKKVRKTGKQFFFSKLITAMFSLRRYPSGEQHTKSSCPEGHFYRKGLNVS